MENGNRIVELLEKLLERVESQQKQMESQQKQMESQQKQMGSLQHQIESLQNQINAIRMSFEEGFDKMPERIANNLQWITDKQIRDQMEVPRNEIARLRERMTSAEDRIQTLEHKMAASAR